MFRIVRDILQSRKKEEGFVLILSLLFIALMVLSTVSLSTMIQQDVRLIGKIKEREQARFMAEAGINHALGNIKEDGYASFGGFSGSMDTGSYIVSKSTVSGRDLIRSVGTVNSISETVSIEVKDNFPTAINYFSGAGNDIKINSLVADSSIVGDIHANNDVYLKSGFIFSWLTIAGDVSATGIVKEGTKYDQGSGDMWDNHVVINGASDDTATVYEGADRITFPSFDYSKYKEEAIASGDYYSSDQSFSSVTLSPGNGIVYVEGDATFSGTSVLNGGIIADNISIQRAGGASAIFTQYKSGDRNIIVAKNGDIDIRGRFAIEEALVFAAQNIQTQQVLSFVDVNGLMLAKGDIDMWNVVTSIDYRYVYTVPSDMLGEDGEAFFKLVSWNE